MDPCVTFYRGGVARTWILRTETKGTGAQMVPLDSVTNRSSAAEPVSVPRKPRPRPKPQAPTPRSPRRFRIVDVVTRQVLTDDATAREAVEALKDVRALVDVNVYVWQDEGQRWRLLTLGEQRMLLELARRTAAGGA